MATGELLFSETRGAFCPTKKYFLKNNSIVSEDEGESKAASSGPAQSFKITLRQVFLPHGYPQSVSPDYVTYQIWDTLQAFASSITGSLATEAVMKGVGVGSSTATPLAAALTWLLKSGSGHIGQIVFAWAKGTSLDHDCKKWRLFADALNDVATFIDLIAPIFPSNMVVFVLCSASIARALVGVAGSATRAAVTQHQARRNNMADVSAKDGSQETLVNLMALITSLILLPLVSGKMMAVWILYMMFTSIHIVANYKAVTSLEIETLNSPRLLLCLQDYLRKGNVSSVKEINSWESVILGKGVNDVDVCGRTIKLGVSLQVAMLENGVRSIEAFQKIIDASLSKPFVIIPSNNQQYINVILHENIQPHEILEAYCRSVLLGLKMQSGKISDLNAMDSGITKDWEVFKTSTERQGFTFSQAPLDTGDVRGKWLH